MDNVKNDAYGNVDSNIVYETLKNDMPELLEMLEDEGCLDL